MKKIKVLQKIYSLTAGGVETIITSIDERLDKNVYEFTYLLDNDKSDFYKSKLNKLGSNVYSLELDNFRGIQKIINKFKRTIKFLKNNKFDIIHVNESNINALIIIIAARIAGVKSVIVHAHTSNKHDKLNLSKLLNPLIKMLVSKLATECIACSDEAAKWYFTKERICGNKFNILKNGINTQKYIYDENIRNMYRKKLKIQDKFVIGHVGRFAHQKNQLFLINVFNLIVKNNSNALLLLIGDGSDIGYAKNKVKELGIEDSVVFAGARSDVPQLLQAMDIFVFPSISEGFGMGVLESQAASLRTIASDRVSISTKVTTMIEYLSLDLGAEIWANKIKNYNTPYVRTDVSSEIVNSGYDICNSAELLSTIYNRCLEVTNEKNK